MDSETVRFVKGVGNYVCDVIRSYSAALALAMLIVGVGIWLVWDFRIRPLFIPKAEIEAVVDKLIAEHDPRAEEIAHIEEDRAWRYSKIYQQEKWRRVRRELWRRHRAGEWE
ncbi:hypothetical protein MNBD_ALPHA04-2020 [hydrothermal vent metagenome]|uniref:Uncharacterized protein n=1 Tax=hydrothermal vent metagenome TaxID=652676 RepID=A0A3B0TAP3_9ZZZZ